MSDSHPFLRSTAAGFGPLEEKILRELCSRGNATVRELVSTEKNKLAYTTVMTTVDRLYKKGFLDRFSEGKAYRYFARHTFGEIQRLAALEGIRRSIVQADSSSLLLSNLVDTLTDHDEHLLDELESLLRRKRRQMKQERS